MKYFLILFLILFIDSCKPTVNEKDFNETEQRIENNEDKEFSTINKEKTNNKNIENNINNSFLITNTTFEAYKNALNNYTDKILYDYLDFKKTNGVIRLPVAEKRRPFVIFRDSLLNTDNIEVKEYQYIGQFKKINQYILSGSFWEHEECYLVDKSIGKIDTLWDCPIISPDNYYLANKSMPYGMEGVPNGIQIWKILRNNKNSLQSFSIIKFIELDQEKWVPKDIVWEDSKTLIIKAIYTEKYSDNTGNINENPNDFIYYRLNLK